MITSRMDKSRAVSDMRELFEWDKWIEEIPYIDFHKDWLIKAVPPYNTGIIRYYLQHKKIKGSRVSIYLDCYDSRWCDGAPYWEVYPYDRDIYRCDLKDTDSLLRAIKQSFKEQK